MDTININALEYLGSYRMPNATYGDSSMNYACGPFDYDASSGTMFFLGHDTQGPSVAEFNIPTLSTSTTYTDMNTATNLQVFKNFKSSVQAGANPDGLDFGGGIYCVPGDNRLLVTMFEFYNAAAGNTDSMYVVSDRTDLANATVGNWLHFDFQGDSGANHYAGWISAIPSEHQSNLGGDTLIGHSSGSPIITSHSIGPTAFSFNMADIGTDPIPNTMLLDYPYGATTGMVNVLDDDVMHNIGLISPLWNYLAWAAYGVVLKGTNTYMVIGWNGGLNSEICYKCIPTGGSSEYGGYGPKTQYDYNAYYWLFDVNDLIDVKNGVINEYDPAPYAHGTFATEWTGTVREFEAINGATYDAANNKLYVALRRADPAPQFDNPPFISVYTVNTEVVNTFQTAYQAKKARHRRDRR